MSNPLEEYGPFGQPQPPERDDSFDVYFRYMQRGGPLPPIDVFRDVTQYSALLEVARNLIRERAYTRHLPMLSGDFQGIIRENGTGVYIDALLTAQRAYTREHWRKEKRYRRNITKPAFLIHSVAVRNASDDIERARLRSKDDIGGYYVTAMGGQKTWGFFVGTKDRALIKTIHDAVVVLCSQGAEPYTQDHALRKVFRHYTREPLSENIRDVQFIWRGDFSIKPGSGSIGAGMVDDEVRDEMPPYSWEDRAEAFVECKKIARQTVPAVKDEKTLHSLTHSWHGYLPSSRAGDPERCYMDETISAYPGGILIYTRAVGAHEKGRALQSPSEVIKYLCSVGMKGTEKNVEIYTANRSLANEVHLRILDELRQSDDMRLRRDALPVLKKIIREYKTADNPNKVVHIAFS